VEYRLLIDLEAVEVLDRLPKRVRHRILDQFHKIRSFPSDSSDYYERDTVGRRVEICVFSGWAIHYWIDSADRHVKVLLLTRAER